MSDCKCEAPDMNASGKPPAITRDKWSLESDRLFIYFLAVIPASVFMGASSIWVVFSLVAISYSFPYAQAKLNLGIRLRDWRGRDFLIGLGLLFVSVVALFWSIGQLFALGELIRAAI